MSYPCLQKNTAWLSDHDHKCAVSDKGLEGSHVREVCKKESSFWNNAGWEIMSIVSLYKRVN